MKTSRYENCLALLFDFPFLYLQDLPKVPVPDLDQTMTEYVRIMEPILTPQQHNRLKEIVKQFSSPPGLGPVLQEYLQEKRERDVNWVSISLSIFYNNI